MRTAGSGRVPERDLASRVTLAVLCGGRGTRMGGAVKGLLENGDGVTILETIERELESAVARVLLVAPLEIANRLRSVVKGEIVLDRGRGPMRALVEAAARTETEWLLAVGGDQPRPDVRLLHRLFLRACPQADAVAVVVDGEREPLWALYRTRAVLAAEGAFPSGEEPALRALLALLRTEEVAAVDLEPSERACFLDADTSEDILALGLERSARTLLVS